MISDIDVAGQSVLKDIYGQKSVEQIAPQGLVGVMNDI